MFTEPKKTASGLYVVDWQNNYPAWRAWREWYTEAFGKEAFPQKMTTLFAWPPSSPTGAQAVADWLQGHRNEIAKEPGKHGGGACAAIPDVVVPWRGWDDKLRADVAADEAQRRKNWDSAFVMAPKYPVRHRMGFRYPKPIDGQQVRAEAPRGYQAAE